MVLQDGKYRNMQSVAKQKSLFLTYDLIDYRIEINWSDLYLTTYARSHNLC